MPSSTRPARPDTNGIFDNNIGIDRAIERAKPSTMVGRIGEPEEIANMVLWLCSEEASYVTGTVYDVSGE